jgi:hypothetical protein
MNHSTQYTRLPKADRTTTEEYVHGLHTSPEDFETLQYILGTIYLEYITENSGGRFPVLKHPSNPEFLGATYKAMKLLFALDDIPRSWYRRARTEIATRSRKMAQNFLDLEDPTPDKWFTFWELKFAEKQSVPKSTTIESLESIAAFENALDAHPSKETNTEVSKKRRRDDLTDDLTDNTADIAGEGRPRKKTKTDDEGNGPPAKRT